MQIEVFGDRYQLQEPIGRGGMATIYRGRDLHMERTVAIKVLREVYSTDPKFVTRFQREAKAASALQHPNIVQVYDYGHTDGSYFIVMELVEGTDLRRYLRSRGVLTIDRAIIIAHDVALGLGAAHRRGIVHRDVKPQNVLVGRDGSIKLTDFGIAMIYNSSNAERLTTTGMTLGTVQYYAPEQAQGEIVSPSADIYALGIVMYEMLTGRTPFDGDTPVAVAMQHIQDAPVPPTQLNPGIPPVLEEIILRCLEKVPEMRYRDGSVLARALELLGEEEMGEPMPGMLPPSGMNGLSNSGPQKQIPPRPGTANGRGVPQRASSSPNNMSTPMAPPLPTPLVNGMEQGYVGTNGNGANGYNGAPPNDINNLPTVAGYGALPGATAGPGFEQNQGYYGTMPSENGSSTTRPFPRGTMPRSGVIQDQHESRFASIITALILLATLLLLGFSIYLAGMLGLFHAPWTPPTTIPADQVVVPSFLHMTFNDANSLASTSKLKLNVQGTPPAHPNDCISSQNPPSGGLATSGSTVSVSLGPCPSTPVAKVPKLVGMSLKNAENTLTAAGIHYTIQNAGPDSALQSNTVKLVNPAEGQPLSATGVVLHVANCSDAACPALPTTTPVKTATPIGKTPTATSVPSPTPTATPAPSPTATPTTGPSPTVTPTPPAGTPPPTP